MRLGWLAAGAALMMAAQANAATWVRYTAYGAGRVHPTNSGPNMPYSFAADFAFVFTVDIEPATLSESGYSSTGYAFFRPGRPGVIEISSYSSPGTLRFSEGFLSSNQIMPYGIWTGRFSPSRNRDGFPLTAPSDVSGDVYYVDSRFEAYGTISRVGVTKVAGSAEPDFNYTVPGVPEPATWATIIVGLGLAGTAVRRKKRQALTQMA